jgi:hypothetical protein
VAASVAPAAAATAIIAQLMMRRLGVPAPLASVVLHGPVIAVSILVARLAARRAGPA